MKLGKIHCGAQTKSGDPCKAPAGLNGKCKLHGGASTGAPGNDNASIHGIYGDLLRANDLAIAGGVRSVQGIDDELLIVRFQLRRALKAQELADMTNDGLELDERIKRVGAENAAAGLEEKYRRRDYNTIIDRLVARIESLNKTRAALGSNAPKTDDMTAEDTFISPDEPIPDNPIL